MRPKSCFPKRFAMGSALATVILGLTMLPDNFGLAQEPKTGPSKTTPKTDGNWKAKEATLNGMELGAPFLMAITLQLKGDQYEVKVGAKIDKGKCEILTDSKPNRMKITGSEGPNEGKSIWAIFEQTNPDQLKVCYNLKKKEYPKAFESTQENGEFLVIYERVK